MSRKTLQSWLEPAAREAAMKCPLRHQMFIGGFVDRERFRLVLVAADLKVVTIPFHLFRPSGDGTKPDFDDFSIIDFGHSVRLGEYESAADAIFDEAEEIPRS